MNNSSPSFYRTTLIFWRQRALPKRAPSPHWISHNSPINIVLESFPPLSMHAGQCDGLNGNPAVWKRACCFDSMLLDLHILSPSLELINPDAAIRAGRTCLLSGYHTHTHMAHARPCIHISPHTHTLFQLGEHSSSASPHQRGQKEDKVHSVSVDEKTPPKNGAVS